MNINSSVELAFSVYNGPLPTSGPSIIRNVIRNVMAALKDMMAKLYNKLL